MSSTASPPYEEAPLRSVPATTFYSIEYPSLLVSDTAIPTAIASLGGQASLDAAFRRNSAICPIELNFRPGNPYAHPVVGEVHAFRGLAVKIVKKTKRKRMQPKTASADGTTIHTAGESSREETGGIFTAEVVGRVAKTARFRAMADFSFQPQEPNPILDLREALGNLDAEYIHQFRFSPEKEDYVIQPEAPTDSAIPPLMPISNMRLVNPPRFSNHSIPSRYDYKQNPAAMPTTYFDEVTGEEKSRYLNKFRQNRGVVTLGIPYDDPDDLANSILIPTAPPELSAQVMEQVDDSLLDTIRKLFEKRPIWQRIALTNQLSDTDARAFANSRPLSYLTAYLMTDGPWRDLLIRYGYDPRKDPASRIYQRLQFRNIRNEMFRAPVHRVVEGGAPAVEVAEVMADRDRSSHIFDGQTLHRNIPAFQLCDIEDGLLKTYIYDEDVVRDECHPIDGWYESLAFDRIKSIARRKFFGLVEGRIVTDAECEDLTSITAAEAIAKNDRKERAARRMAERGPQRKGHNMALVPAPAEEVAAARLLRALQTEQRNLGSDFEDEES